MFKIFLEIYIYIKLFFKNNVQKITEINQKYTKPRIEMSFGVKFALLFLRLYLLFLVGLLVIKFISLVKAGA
jgi:hypothetical protein